MTLRLSVRCSGPPCPRPGRAEELLPEEPHCRLDLRVVDPRLEVARRGQDVRAVVEEEVRQAEAEGLVRHCPLFTYSRNLSASWSMLLMSVSSERGTLIFSSRMDVETTSIMSRLFAP